MLYAFVIACLTSSLQINFADISFFYSIFQFLDGTRRETLNSTDNCVKCPKGRTDCSQYWYDCGERLVAVSDTPDALVCGPAADIFALRIRFALGSHERDIEDKNYQTKLLPLIAIAIVASPSPSSSVGGGWMWIQGYACGTTIKY